jgi:adenylosuccinate lyase
VNPPDPSDTPAGPLGALSPLDGRYADRVREFADAFSELALTRYRFAVEVEWLLLLADHPGIGELPAMSHHEVATLRRWVAEFGIDDATRIKAIEATTNHDVKAVEYYLKERLAAIGFGPRSEFVHFACTSEDINNLAYALMVRQGVADVWLPLAEAVVANVGDLAERYAALSMLSHTHGQAATPTTLGKELAVFVHRLRRQIASVRAVELLGKFNGAVGTHGAHLIAYPEVDWLEVSRRFVESLGLGWNPLTTQIESHDYLAELFHGIVRFNTVLVDFCRDAWAYISLGYLRQRLEAGEVGSSTMPHKINPIDFENAEANAQMSTAVLEHLATKLMVSRLQRDLSDSSAMRNIGSGLAYSGVALRSTIRGLGRIQADPVAIAADLDAEWGVLGEAIQTVMRRYGFDEPYERLKALTRGTTITEDDVRTFVSGLGLPADAEARLLALTPASYIGVAPTLARMVRSDHRPRFDTSLPPVVGG